MAETLIPATDDVRHEWRTGWPLVLACLFGVGVVAVPTYTIGLFVKPLSDTFGWSISEIVFAQTLYALTAGITSALAGIAMDRLGARPLALGGAMLLCLAFASLALTNGSLTQFYGLWIVAALGTTLTSPMIWLKAIVDRFDRHRGLASSVALCGSNVSGGIAPLIAAYLIAAQGLKSAYLGLAAYMFVSALPLGWLFFHDRLSLDRRVARSSPVARAKAAELQPGLSVAAAIRTREFWALLLSFFFAGAAITAFIVHLVPVLQSKGIQTILAASAVTAFSIAAICGRLLAGWLIDRVFAPRLAAVAMLLPLGATFALTGDTSYAGALIAATLVGLSTGAEYNMMSYLTVRYFGFRRYGTISSYLNTTFTFGCMSGPLIAAWSYTNTRQYDQTVLFLGGSFLVAATLMLLCRAYPAGFSTATD